MNGIIPNFQYKHYLNLHSNKIHYFRKVVLLAITFFFTQNWVAAQQKLNRSNMSYIIAPKPNNIVYHDSIFRGSAEFKYLFFRTGDTQLMDLFNKHQSNKIIGQICSLVGAVGILSGVNRIAGDNKGTGWALIGGGFITAAAGGYFTLASQKNLVTAVSLFNLQYNQASVGIGLSNQSIGLVYKF